MRVWLTCLIVLAAASASAQPAVTTDKAVAVEAAAEQKLAQVNRARTQLTNKYHADLDVVDRLKKEKPSWRRDRELRETLADSNDTATQLGQLIKQATIAGDAVAKARATAIAAIDAELVTGLTGPRAQKLAQLRAQLATQAGATPKKLVIPDAEIDPSADPDELDQQAAALHVAEDELGRQEQGLDTQAKDLKQMAEVRKQHERAGDMMLRDDDQPHRTAPSAARSTADSIGGAGAGQGGGSGAGGTNGDHFGGTTPPPSAFENAAPIVLGDVINPQAIEGMLRASRSGDPAQRADAAEHARDAVHVRLELLKKKRAAIEARAKLLRNKR